MSAHPTGVAALTVLAALATAPLAAAAGWRIEPVRAPKPPGSNRPASLAAVSCTSAKWSTESASSPKGAKNVSVNGVSCTSRHVCVAVGCYRNQTHAVVPLIEREA
jgi:hypothetical protein